MLEQVEDSKKPGHHYACRCIQCGEISIKDQYSITRLNISKCQNCKPNFHFIIKDDIAIGTLPSGDQFVIDKEDINRVSQFWWYKKSDMDYIVRNIKSGPRPRLHRFILGLGSDNNVVVDHINRNSLDCRKSNLRIATQQQNCFNKGPHSLNTTGYTGVKYNSRRDIYNARIQLGGKVIDLGNSDDPILCAQMHDYAAKLLFREFTGQMNDVPEPSLKLKRKIEKKCSKYKQLADQLTQPMCGLSFCSNMNNKV